jgi:hypothetical protein
MTERIVLTEEQAQLIGKWWNPIADRANRHAKSHTERNEQWKGIEVIAHALFRYLPTVVSKDLVLAWLEGDDGPEELEFKSQFLEALNRRIAREDEAKNRLVQVIDEVHNEWVADGTVKEKPKGGTSGGS